MRGRWLWRLLRFPLTVGLTSPQNLTMIAKALLNLDRVVFTLDPNFEPSAVIRQRATEILQRNLMKSITPANLISSVVEVKEFAEKLPTRINKILDTIGNNELKVNVDAIDEKAIVEGFQKVANRITLGLILAARSGLHQEAASTNSTLVNNVRAR